MSQKIFCEGAVGVWSIYVAFKNYPFLVSLNQELWLYFQPKVELVSSAQRTLRLILVIILLVVFHSAATASTHSKVVSQGQLVHDG